MARPNTPNLKARFRMSTHHLTPAERFEVAVDDLDDLRDELLTRLGDAAELVEHLALVQADAGIQPATHPEIAEAMDLLRRLLAEHAPPEGSEPTLADIVQRIAWQESRDEE
jgi:hypothetical protein